MIGFRCGWLPSSMLTLLQAFCHLILIVTKEGVRKTRAPPLKDSSGSWASSFSKLMHVSFKTGDELIFLDPHTTQTFVDTEENGTVDDQTFHCLQSPQRMNILNLDPSVALVGIWRLGGPRDMPPCYRLVPWELSRLLGRVARVYSLTTPMSGRIV